MRSGSGCCRQVRHSKQETSRSPRAIAAHRKSARPPENPAEHAGAVFSNAKWTLSDIERAQKPPWRPLKWLVSVACAESHARWKCIALLLCGLDDIQDETAYYQFCVELTVCKLRMHTIHFWMITQDPWVGCVGSLSSELGECIYADSLTSINNILAYNILLTQSVATQYLYC